MTYTDAVRLYFKDIEKIPLLTHTEEIKVARRVRKGDAKARKQLVRSNLRLVINIAKRYSYTGVPMLDLIEEGNIGLIKAAVKFDPNRGFRFSTYAAWWIKQYILRAIANQGKTIRVPVYMVEAIVRYKKAIEHLKHLRKRMPTTGEIAKKLKLSVKKVGEIAQVSQVQPTSLETPVGDESAGQFLELIEDESASAPDDNIADTLQHEHVKRLLARLPARDRKILCMRFGIDNEKVRTLQDIAKGLKITKERVRQIEERAIKHLKDLIVEDGVKSEDEELT